mmetsp:Transcript_23577/g.32657  ORF Transcript_23577/g.32657 Transcript_23577/m.32657 type:complete len:333 (-) Transcript_23577:138-1136(-)
MSFRREVPSLSSLCLKMIGRYPLKALTRQTVETSFYGEMAVSSKHHKMTNTLNEIRNLVVLEMTNNGKMQDNSLPENFLDETVREVTFRDSKISNSFLEEIATSCPDLESLDFAGCFNIWDAGVGQVLRACPQVRAATLTNCRKLTDKCLAYGAKYGRRLKRIRLGGCFNLTANGLTTFLQRHPNAHRLLELDLSGLALSPEALAAVGGGCPRLERLGLGYLEQPPADAQRLLRALPQLKSLSLHWSTCIDDAFLLFIATNCKLLREIDFTGVKNISMQGITSLIEQKTFKAQEDPNAWNGVTKLSLRYTNISKQDIGVLEQSYPDLNIVTT